MTQDHEPELDAIARRLERERPLPRPAFRGELRRRLVAGGARPLSLTRVRRQILAYAGSGFCLLAVAAAGLVGLGPLAT
jgi:hypothetical protein